MKSREEILNYILSIGFPSNEVAIPFEDFFENNNDDASIGVNLSPRPATNVFYQILQNIKAETNTENILVRIADTDTDWFYSDAVYIIGKWTREELAEKLTILKPDEIHHGWLYKKPVNVVDTYQSVYTVWWD